MNYYERHLGDYAKDTAHLSMLEHGAYSLLLDRYYSTESGIPEDQAHRVARARSRDEKAAVDAVLAEFFTLDDGVWTNNRTEEEIEKARARIEAASANGKRGGRPRKNQDESKTKAKITQPFPSGSENKTQSKALHLPDTRHQTPIIDADDGASDPLTELSDALFAAGGAALDQTSTALIVLSRPIAWLEDGCDLERDILPAIRAASARAGPQSIRTWKYFDRAVADAKANRLKPMPEGRTDERTRNHEPQRRPTSFDANIASLARSRGT